MQQNLQRKIEDPPSWQNTMFTILTKFAAAHHPHSVVQIICFLFTAIQWVGFADSSAFQKHSTISLLATIFRSSHIYPFLVGGAYNVVIMLGLSFFILLILVLGLLLLTSDQPRYPGITKLARYLATFHHTWLFLPIIGISLHPFACTIVSDCNYSLVIISLSVFLSLLHCLLAITFTLTCFDQNLRSIKVVALIFSRSFFYCLLLRFSAYLLITFPLLSGLHTSTLILCFAFFIPIYYCFTQPFVTFSTNKYVALFYSLAMSFLLVSIFSLSIVLLPIPLILFPAGLLALHHRRISSNWLALSPEAFIPTSRRSDPPAIEFLSSWIPKYSSDVSIAIRSHFTTSPANALVSWNVIFGNSRRYLPSEPLPVLLHGSILLSFPHDHMSAQTVIKPLLVYASHDIRFMAHRLTEQCLKFSRGLQSATTGGVLSAARTLADQTKQTDQAFLKAIEKFPNDRDLLAEYAKFLDDIVADEVKADIIWERYDDLNDELAAQKEHEKIRRSGRRGSVSNESGTEGTKSGTNTHTSSQEEQLPDEEQKLAELLGVSVAPVDVRLTTVNEGDGGTDYESDGSQIEAKRSATDIFEDSRPFEHFALSTYSPQSSATDVFSPRPHASPLAKLEASKLRKRVGDNSLRISDLLGGTIQGLSPSTTLMLKDEAKQKVDQDKGAGPRLVVKRKHHTQAQEIKQKKKDAEKSAFVNQGDEESAEVHRPQRKLEDAISKALNSSKKTKMSAVIPSKHRFTADQSDSQSELSVVEADSDSGSEISSYQSTSKQSKKFDFSAVSSESTSKSKSSANSKPKSKDSDPGFAIPGIDIRQVDEHSSSSGKDDRAHSRVISSESSEVDRSDSFNDSSHNDESHIRSTSDLSGGTTTRSGSIKFVSTSKSKTYDESIGSTLSSGKAPRGWSHVDAKSATMGTTADIPEDLRSQSTNFKAQRRKRRKKLHRGRASLRSKSAARRLSTISFYLTLVVSFLCLSFLL
ncbi:hypothetical protein GEMRC1_013248 [Eukaryota sp. GEM-RC1]